MSRGGRRGNSHQSQSFNREQLVALGVTGPELGSSTENITPPPIYPQFERKPVPLQKDPATAYLHAIKQDLMDAMQLSGAYLKTSKPCAADSEMESLVAQLPTMKHKYDWRMLPIELRPKLLAKRSIAAKELSQKKSDDEIAKKLRVLEQLEGKSYDQEISDEVVVVGADMSSDSKTPQVVEINDDDDNEAEVIESDEAEDIDDEMDNGTDYGNNYFENGEEYDDEEDNLDDGPIY